MEDIRQQIFAKIENLLVLNRTKLDFSERMGSEVDYLKKFSSDWFTANKSEDKTELKKFIYDHPNFNNLAKSKLSKFFKNALFKIYFFYFKNTRNILN